MSQLTIFLAKSVLALLLTFFGIRHLTPMDQQSIISVAGVLSTVSGILFGFVLAAITIFTSADSSKGLLGALKKNNVLKGIVSGLINTGATLIASCIFPLVAMFFHKSQVVNLPVDFALTLLGLSFLMISITTFFFSWRNLAMIIPHL
ncbi:hypothetical protein [Serratia sp. UGAL515B_01]|uniref:hypothetical protein n=1 Tax=Serratia sp. UGAL515B_01 TaxID=2986763 RepID=UPI00295408F8|nr:hypothetical protein [Serratia sp. UGAL515B_01]WON77549.1 hypothetical protein OK023_02250 [Serratia sp. UGAL515B_01]